WGPDGTAWGGEILVASYARFERAATFRPIPLAGGDFAIREPWRIALALVDDAFGADAPIDRLAVFSQVPARAIAVVRGMIATGTNAPLARGVGRLFDGIGALALSRSASTYEGQVAIAWNVAIAPGEHGRYPFAIEANEVDLRSLVRAVVADLIAGVAPGIVSARFHATLIEATIDRVRATVASHGRLPVVLTGGAFQNPQLAEGVRAGLADLEVYSHGEVPPGDGGLALGQALIGDAIARYG
ncbi:MAG: carbamoyltransferase HypF, partial [Kofleriaceae bacterium]